MLIVKMFMVELKHYLETYIKNEFIKTPYNILYGGSTEEVLGCYISRLYAETIFILSGVYFFLMR